MKTAILQRTLAIVNLVILLVLLADTYFIPTARHAEVFHIYNSVHSGSEYGSGSWTNYIETISGQTYWEPNGVLISLERGDSFVVEKSRLFRKPLRLIYPRPVPETAINCGGLNEGYLTKVLSVYIIIVSLITLAGWTVFKKPNHNERLIFSGSTLLAVVIFAYFYA